MFHLNVLGMKWKGHNLCTCQFQTYLGKTKGKNIIHANVNAEKRNNQGNLKGNVVVII